MYMVLCAVVDIADVRAAHRVRPDNDEMVIRLSFDECKHSVHQCVSSTCYDTNDIRISTVRSSAFVSTHRKDIAVIDIRNKLFSRLYSLRQSQRYGRIIVSGSRPYGRLSS